MIISPGNRSFPIQQLGGNDTENLALLILAKLYYQFLQQPDEFFSVNHPRAETF